MQEAKSPEAIQASLGKPGEGLPLMMRLMGRFFVKPFRMKKTKWADCETQFHKAHARLMKEIEKIPQDQLTARVLVPAQVGLEDSSRYWSTAMTARHLLIVGQGIEKIIIGLSQKKPVGLKVDIAKLKPESELNEASAIAEYLRFADTVISRIQKELGDPLSSATHYHPWFGQLTAKDWLWLLGMHTNIHRKQIENIRLGLK